jgi:PKD repeat protein
MKKQLFTIIAGAGLCLSSYAQLQNQGLTLKPCNTYAAMEEVFTADPSAKTRYNLVQSQLELEYLQAMQQQALSKTTVVSYTIPVVFHILHLGGSENISDATVIAAMDQINKDYSKLGSDTTGIDPTFAPLYVNSNITFALAKKDPNGNCTNGIIHHYDANTNWVQSSSPYNYSGSGTNRWPTNKYLNVYLVKCIDGGSSSPCPPVSSFIGGYTYLPGTWATNSSNDAIVYRADQLSGLSTRALSHEMGHWLNLSHTFGNTNNPGVTCGSTSGGDGVSDTPDTKGNFSTCPASSTNSTVICTSGANPYYQNVQNFMDYSSCPKMFTQGQVTKMRSAIISTTSGRNNVISAANLAATGLTGTYTCTPIADFKVNKTMLCSGQTLTYTDMSQVGTSGNISWTFEGGSPATSTATSVVVTYSTAGTYSVSLTATNASGTNTKNQTSYIAVTAGGGGILAPYAQNFEAASLPSDIAITNANAGSIAWTQNTVTGANSTAKSIYLNNASASTGGNLDIFETSIFDFHNTTSVSLSYWYAYAKKTATQADTFKVQYSTDCGGTWSNVIGIPSIATMATNTGGTTSTAFVPTAAQWKQANISSALLSALNNKPSVKFRFYFRADATAGSSNNIYIDEINLAGTVGLNELENIIELNMYPNPTNASAMLDFTITGNETTKVTVMDIVGRIVEESTTPTINGKNISYTVNKNGALAKGIYIVNIDVNNQRISKKLIIE